MKINRWTPLIMGVMVAICAMLGANHLPWWKKPEIAENRVLAQLPEPPSRFGELGVYRKGMDAYVADNFPARTWFIAGINYLRYRLGYSGTARVGVGKDGWLFYDDGNHMLQLRHALPLSNSDLNAWLATFAARTDYLAKRGIAYFVVTPPVKERIFPEFAPVWAFGPGEADADALEAKVKAAGMENFLVLKSTMAEARLSQPRIYSLFDTHWTGYGAYAGYVRILNALHKAGVVQVDPLPLQSFSLIDKTVLSRPQDLASMLGISSFVHQNFPQFHDPRQDAALKITYLTDRHDWTGDRVIDTGNAGKPVLQLVVDSFSNDLLPFLYSHFSRIVVSHNQNGFFREDLTNAYHPNIVMIEVLESGVRHSMSPAMRPSAAIEAQLMALQREGTRDARSSVSEVRATIRTAGEDALTNQQIDAATYHCNLESFALSEDARPRLIGAGWTADLTKGVTTDQVTLVLRSKDASYITPVQAGIDRPDVVAYFKKAGIVHAGFQLDAAAPSLKDGVYDLFLVQRYRVEELVCRTKQSLKVEHGKMTVVPLG